MFSWSLTGNGDGPDLRIESRVAGYSGLTAGRGRVTSVQLDVAAAGKGFQRRAGRMEIREEAGVSVWRAISPTADTAHAPCPAEEGTVINTDHWNERWPDHPVIRTFEPAKPVKVDIGRALPLGRGGASRADHVSMRVKTSALYMSGYLGRRFEILGENARRTVAGRHNCARHRRRRKQQRRDRHARHCRRHH